MAATSNLLFAPYRLDLQNEQLWRADDLIPLRAKPFALLRYMAENPARLVLHEELRKAIWPTTYVSEGVLRVYLREVRAALEDNSESPRFIETIARRGYRFLAEVERVTATGTSKVAGDEIQARSAPLMVGRNVELARLRGAFAKATQGARQIVFLDGEAGIGKTTILESFLNEVAGDDVWIARGQCVEHRGESEPYLPMLDALHRLAHQADSAKVVDTLSKYAPTWLVQMPGLIDDAGVQRSAKEGRRRQPAADAARDGRYARATEQPAAAGAGIRGSALERSFDDHVARSARAADRARAIADSRHASTGRYSARGASASNPGARIGGKILRELVAAAAHCGRSRANISEIESSRPMRATRYR